MVPRYAPNLYPTTFNTPTLGSPVHRAGIARVMRLCHHGDDEMDVVLAEQVEQLAA